MSDTRTPARRAFLGAGVSPLAAAFAQVRAQQPAAPRPGQARVRLGIVGFGRQGVRLAAAAAGTQGAEVTAVADLYDGRLERAREMFGASLPATRDYRPLLERSVGRRGGCHFHQ